MEYELIILGGGISSLYFLYNLVKTDNYPKILLLESNNKLGGRINTVIKGELVMETGGARFNNNHVLLNLLIEEMNLNEKKIMINNYKRFIDKKNPKDEPNDLDSITNRLLNIFNNLSKKEKSDLKNTNIYNFCKNNLGDEEAKKLLQRSPYYNNIIDENAYDCLSIFNKDYKEDIEYYILNGGLSQLVNEIHNRILKICKIKNINLDIKLNNIVSNIKNKNNNGNYEVYVNDNIYYGKKIVNSILPETIMNFDLFKNNKNFCNKYLKNVKSYPLLRIYQEYPIDKRKKDKSWFSNIKKIITNDEIKYIIPVNDNTGLIMTSYTDSHLAENLYKKYLEGKLENTLENSFKKLFPEKKIPKAKETFVFYWNRGCYYNPVKTSSENIYKKINKLPYNDVYLIGEAYSNYHSWIEGSLLSATFVLSNFF
jgi:hypothetical protein